MSGARLSHLAVAATLFFYFSSLALGAKPKNICELNLRDSQHPQQAIAFDKLSAGDLRSAYTAARKEYKRKIRSVIENTDPPTFANTILAYDEASHRIDDIEALVGVLLSAHGAPVYRRMATKFIPRGENERQIADLDPRLYARVEAVFQQRRDLGLTADEVEQVVRTRAAMLDAGVLLSPKTRAELIRIGRKILELQERFLQNLKEAEEAAFIHVTDARELEGIPESIVSKAAQVAESRGVPGWVLRHMDSCREVLLYGSNPSLRKRFWQLQKDLASSGETDNRPLVFWNGSLRQRAALIRGHANAAELKLKGAMAATPGEVRAFLDAERTKIFLDEPN